MKEIRLYPLRGMLSRALKSAAKHKKRHVRYLRYVFYQEFKNLYAEVKDKP